MESLELASTEVLHYLTTNRLLLVCLEMTQSLWVEVGVDAHLDLARSVRKQRKCGWNGLQGHFQVECDLTHGRGSHLLDNTVKKELTTAV